MDIRNWPINRIMQLPGCCFGRRWPIGLQAAIATGAEVFDIAEFALPERCVIWEIMTASFSAAGATVLVSLRLADQLPTVAADFFALDGFIQGIEDRSGSRGGIETAMFGGTNLLNLRIPVESAGRRIVARFIRAVGTSLGAQVTITVSSIPTEVPDWLISGPGRSL